MGPGKRSAIRVLDSLECFISATIGTANTFRCGPWPCIGICGRAGRCGPTKYGSTYSRPAVIEPIVEDFADVIRWRGATPLRICCESPGHLCRDSLGISGRSARAPDGSHCDSRRSPLPYWPARRSHLLAHSNRRRPDGGPLCRGKGSEGSAHVAGDVYGFCLRACSGSGGGSHRRHIGIFCAG